MHGRNLSSLDAKTQAVKGSGFRVEMPMHTADGMHGRDLSFRLVRGRRLFMVQGSGLSVEG